MDFAVKDLETSAPLSWVTSSKCEEDVGAVEPLYLPVYHEYFNLPRRTVVQDEDSYSALLNSSPRKQIPIGPDHQADIPVWSPDHPIQKESGSCSHSLDDKHEQILMGTPVISLPDLDKTCFCDKKIGQGREDYECLEEGSIRCVQQHVKEARNKLRVVLGENNFAELGFYEMGEDVAYRWTEEEERIFHEVIFSNPQSVGKNFWRQLSAVFPTRTKREIVSYYFNVFMLRRRAIQNRSNLLEIDSDDDEWHPTAGGFDGVGEEEDDDSLVDSFADQGLQGGFEGENDDECDDREDDEDDNDDDEGSDDGDFGSRYTTIPNAEDATREHNLSHHTSKPQYGKPFDAVGSGHNDSVFGAGDSQSREKEDLNQCSGGGDCNLSSNEGSESDSVFLLESCDALVWDDSSSMVKVVDFLPTCNMIEEIFGPCSSKRTD